MNKKIAFFAGTFDPLHRGHIAFMRKALGCVDHIYLMPERQPKHKLVLSVAESRLKKLEKDVQKLGMSNISVFHSQFENFKVADILDEIKAEFPGIEPYFMFGDDVLDSMISWQGIERLATDTHLLIATRYCHEDQILEKLQHASELFLHYTVVCVNDPVSSTDIRSKTP